MNRHYLSRLSLCGTLAFAAFVASITSATEIHRYELNGSYADSHGGPSLVPNGGSLSATAYTFGENQGLSLSNALADTGNYSILVDFSFSDLTGYNRIIDFKNGATDYGLYTLNAALDFYPFAGGSADVFLPDTLARLVLTRDSTTNTVSGYVNGIQQFTFNDSTFGEGIFSGPDGIMKFFIDDGSDASAGLVDRIVIYDSPLTAGEVLALGGPTVPEPGSTALFLSGAFVAIAVGKRLRSQRVGSSQS